MIRHKFSVFFGLLLLQFAPTTAYAYLDPGTATVLIQSLVAAAATAWLTTKLYWHRIVKFFTGSKKVATDENVGESETTSDQTSDQKS